MTLLTSVVSQDAVLLATDSAAFGAGTGKPLGFGISKVATLPHLRAVLAIQGHADLLTFLTSNSQHVQSVDDAETMMPRLLRIASQVVPGLAATAINAGCRVALAGFSKSRERMVFMTWTSADGFKTCETATLTKAIFVTPRAPAPRAPIKSTDDLQRFVISEQVPYLRRQDASEPVGGELVLVRVDRHGVRITYGPDMGLPATTRAHADEAVHAILRETAAAIYNPDTSFDVLTVSPNTSLPDPSVVEQITGVTVSSGAADQTDKSVLVRTLVSWTAVTSQAVRQSGRIEVQWIEATATMPAGDWPGCIEVEGNATSVVIPGLRAGVHHLFRVRARNTLGVRGLWSNQKVAQVAAATIAAESTFQDVGYGIATTGGDAAAANRTTYTFKTLNNPVSVSVTGRSTGYKVALNGIGGAIEIDAESTNSPTVAVFAMELRDGSTPLKTVVTSAPLSAVVGGVANNDGGGHGTYNYLNARAALSLTHEMASFSGSKTFNLVFGYLLLNASGAPVAPGSVTYKNSLMATQCTLAVREYRA